MLFRSEAGQGDALLAHAADEGLSVKALRAEVRALKGITGDGKEIEGLPRNFDDLCPRCPHREE